MLQWTLQWQWQRRATTAPTIGPPCWRLGLADPKSNGTRELQPRPAHCSSGNGPCRLEQQSLGRLAATFRSLTGSKIYHAQIL